MDSNKYRESYGQADSGRLGTPLGGKDVPIVTAGLEYLQERLSVFLHTHTELLQRLDPVLTPRPPQTAAGRGEAVPTGGPHSSTSERIKSFVNIVDQLNEETRSVINRLEV